MFAFWRVDAQQQAAAGIYRRFEVPSWDQIAANYSCQTAVRLGDVMRSFRPGHGGRLLLWTGSPGTGKTYALRTLAWEWRRWCSFH